VEIDIGAMANTTTSDRQFSPNAKVVVDLAEHLALTSNSLFTGTEHLLKTLLDSPITMQECVMASETRGINRASGDNLERDLSSDEGQRKGHLLLCQSCQEPPVSCSHLARLSNTHRGASYGGLPGKQREH